MRLRTAIAAVLALAVVVPIGVLWQRSLLPDHYDMAKMGYADYGGGTKAHHHSGTPVAELITDPTRTPDVEEILRVRKTGGRITINGTSPGPTLTAHVGDLVQVRLVNENLADGTALHWHGIDVPNAMDGVAGVTQDAVAPGQEFDYRFVANRPGTYWYHSHQVSHEQVREGLLGPIVILPTGAEPSPLDVTAVIHQYDGVNMLNGHEGNQTIAAAPGDTVRVRAINTDNTNTAVWTTGAPYVVAAVDGTDLNGPTPVGEKRVVLPAGGRVDLLVTVPADGARGEFPRAALVLGSDPGSGQQPAETLDLLSYGDSTDPGLDASHPDREFKYSIGRRPGFLDGKPGIWWTINGHQFPNVPMFMVAEGDVVVFDISNHSGELHPMHLHGHHALVLSRNGEPISGSPLWVDSLSVKNGESYQIAFVADNPGIWVDHCHNLPHAQEGLIAHLMYENVTSSYKIGGTAGNQPE